MKKTKGFTLIELIVVVAIFGIMGAIFIPAIISGGGASSSSYSLNGRVEERCVGGYKHTVGPNGFASQIVSEHGGGIPCR